MYELPSLQDELTRKTVETYEWIIERSQSGQWSEAEVKVAMQTVFNVTAGIVPRDITTAAAEVKTDPAAKVINTRVFYKDADLRVIRWACGDETVYVIASGPKYVPHSAPDAIQARERFSAVCDRLLSTGWTEL